MQYLITGIAGFVGSSLARAILAQDPGARIVGVDNMSYGYKERLNDLLGLIEYHEADVCDLLPVVGRRKFDCIVHCAAIAPLPECQIDSYRAIRENVAVCGAVADYASITGSRNIVFFSSGAVYEGTSVFPTPENTGISTRLVYPTTKYLAEQFFESYTRSHGLNVVSLRLFNLYGPHQDYFRKQPPLIGYLLASMLKGEEAVLFSNGTQRRDYIYIDDLLALVLTAAHYMSKLSHGGSYMAVNAGAGVTVSVNEIVEMLENIANANIHITRHDAGKYWNKYGQLFDREIMLDRSVIELEVQKHTEADVSFVDRSLGWKARVSMYDGLVDCYNVAKSIFIS